MPNETLILDERLDTTGENVERIVSEFFTIYIALPLGIEIAFKDVGDLKIWAIKPENRNDGIHEELINGSIEIGGISFQPERMPVNVRIVSNRYELNLLWLELANFIKSKLILPDLSNSAITGHLTKDILLGTGLMTDEYFNTPNSLSSYTPSQRKEIDKACIGWASRGYLPKYTMSEYLKDFDADKQIYMTIDQFKQALKYAGERGLIVKHKGRWRSKQNNTETSP